MSEDASLRHLPVTLFASVMGLAGLALAFRAAEHVLDFPLPVSAPLTLVAALAFLALCVAYGLKFQRHGEAVRGEFSHPIKLNFFPAISISLALLGTALLDHATTLAALLWWLGALLNLVFTLHVMSQWLLSRRFDVEHIGPAWFIPVVGNIVMPIGGVALASSELSWFFFSTGLIHWLVLLTLIFKRKIFHSTLPPKLVPTLFILVAPPAVGFIAYLQLTGELDAFARLLYYSALFTLLLLLWNLRIFLRLPFFLSWWAYSFPCAAFAVASILMYQHTGLRFFAALGYGLLAVISLLIGYLVMKTLKGLRSGALLQPES